MAVLTHKGKEYDVSTVEEALKILGNKARVCIGKWSGYAFIGTVADFRKEVNSLDEYYQEEHNQINRDTIDPEELWEIETSCEEEEADRQIAEYDSNPYVALLQSRIEEFSFRYIDGKEYIAIHIESDKSFDLW